MSTLAIVGLIGLLLLFGYVYGIYRSYQFMMRGMEDLAKSPLATGTSMENIAVMRQLSPLAMVGLCSLWPLFGALILGCLALVKVFPSLANLKSEK